MHSKVPPASTLMLSGHEMVSPLAFSWLSSWVLSVDSRLDVSSDFRAPDGDEGHGDERATRAMRVCMGGFLSIADAG